jgi:hypothetical protein
LCVDTPAGATMFRRPGRDAVFRLSQLSTRNSTRFCGVPVDKSPSIKRPVSHFRGQSAYLAGRLSFVHPLGILRGRSGPSGLRKKLPKPPRHKANGRRDLDHLEARD